MSIKNRVRLFFIFMLLCFVAIYFLLEKNKIAKQSFEIKYLENAKENIRVGNCYSVEYDNKHYGIVLVNNNSQSEFCNAALLNESFSETLVPNDFKQGEFIYDNIDIPGGAEGLFTGSFPRNEVDIFLENVTYIGTVNINKQKVIIGGGFSLLINSKISIDENSLNTAPSIGVPNTRSSKAVSYFISKK